MRALVDNGLIEDEVAERYRMTPREVRQQLSAVELMDRLYFPITDDPTTLNIGASSRIFWNFTKMVAFRNTAIE